MVLIHTTCSSPRLDYILDYIFRERLGLAYTYDDSAPDIKLRLHYGQGTVPDSLNIHPLGMLERACVLYPLEAALNPFAAYAESATHFPDIFSAAFYHLSRAEEYGAATDQHGRFDFRHSCLYKNGLLEQAPIDIWIGRLAIHLNRHYGLGVRMHNTYKTYASIDIDSFYTYKGRGPLRQAAALLKDVAGGKAGEVFKRLAVLSGAMPDPNDNFKLQQQLLNGRKAAYFIQVGSYGRFDKNISPQNKSFRKQILALSQSGHTIGIHPSYASLNNETSIQKEIQVLEDICGHGIHSSRQHYLRFTLPETYRVLAGCGIMHEHSMGYSQVTGFRAGTACPFMWYDLYREECSSLRIHPFAVMDVAYKQFARLDAAGCIRRSAGLKETCREMGLPFGFVFHNESLSGHRGWENWNQVFSYWINA